jgi:hypothetical protein
MDTHSTRQASQIRLTSVSTAPALAGALKWTDLPRSVKYQDIDEKVRLGSRAKTFAKWVTITGLGLGVLAWAFRIPGHQSDCRQLTARHLGPVHS